MTPTALYWINGDKRRPRIFKLLYVVHFFFRIMEPVLGALSTLMSDITNVTVVHLYVRNKWRTAEGIFFKFNTGASYWTL
jgi:hypothetical protein